ncbi:hypothetical protein HDU86_005569 [Geranomyces michiganensis]|nr:hypothetical protein HDU86_005569 [Geranomyces michiganensis]
MAAANLCNDAAASAAVADENGGPSCSNGDFDFDDRASTARLKGAAADAPIHAPTSGINPLAPDGGGLLSLLSVSWLSPLVSLGSRRPLEIEDVPHLSASLQAATLADRLKPYWRKLAAAQASCQKPPVLLWHISKAVGGPWIFSGIGATVSIACELLSALVLQQLIFALAPDSTTTDPPWIDSAVGLAVLLFVLQVLRSFSRTIKSTYDIVVRMNAMSMLTGVICEKAMRLHCSETQEYSEGRIMNMVSADVKEIFNVSDMLHLIWLTPVQLGLTLWLLNRLIGWSMWIGIGSMGVLMFVLFAFAPVYESFCEQFLAHEDARLDKIREMLIGIQMVKLRAMEAPFIADINGTRDKQIAALRSKVGVNTFAWTLTALIAIVMPVTSFLAFSSRSDVNFDASVIFPALLLFNALAEPLNFYPGLVTDAWKVRVSWRRVSAFLAASEVETPQAEEHPQPEGLISVTAGYFAWATSDEEVNVIAVDKDDKESPVNRGGLLKNINVTIAPGSLVMVVGPVGSGKSSFVSALLGQMLQTAGKKNIYGSIGYAPQQPWIASGSIKENITFATELDEARLKHVINVCSLESDLMQMRAGIETKIGEHGVNLSGGQKSRIALARAVYANPDVLLLDDPLGALDAVVSRDVFAKCIQGLVAARTRVVVTHQLHLLPHADHIIVFEAGEIVQQGRFAELAEASGPLKTLLNARDVHGGLIDGPDLAMETAGVQPLDLEAEEQQEDENFQAEESRIRGRISSAHLMGYVRATGGWKTVTAVLISVILKQMASVMAAVWLAWWSENHFADMSQNEYLKVYGCLAIAQAVSIIFFLVVVYTAGFFASKWFHPAALTGLVRSPLAFFEREPVGRIMNRFSADLDTIDEEVPSELHLFLTTVFDLIGTLILLVWVTPWTFVIAAPVAVCYWYVQRMYRPVAREVRRLMAIQKSPLTAYLSESLVGMNVIRAFRRETDFINKQRKYLDMSLEVKVLRAVCTIWLELRLEFLASFVTLGMSLVGVLSSSATGLVALGLTSTIALNSSVQAFVKASVDLESALAGVERLSEYAWDLPQERAAELPTDPKVQDWPAAGSIVVKDLKAAYESSPDLLILKGLNLEIKPGEHVAIVGRTGSGKSTFLNTLFRTLEYEGAIVIDGVDTSTLGLHALRAGLQIIPQNPVVFEGSIRSNLLLGHIDPSSIDDAQLWSAIKRVGFAKTLEDLTDGLDHHVESGGNSLSFGQRQLLCLAHGLLANPKIMVLDEATASLDHESDLLVQRVIAEDLRNVTVISVAHRLHTIVAFDRVVVMDSGVIVEVGTPANLLASSESHLATLALAMGDGNRDALLRAAQDADAVRCVTN